MQQSIFGQFYGDENKAPRPTANVERSVSNGPVETKKDPRFHSLVRIHIHSIRNRLADPDGVSGKAAIDGLVKGAILADDTAKQVEKVSYSQEKASGRPEETIISVIPV